MLSKMKYKPREAGFSLVEILAVVVIIGILAAIGIPIYQHQKSLANDAAVESDLKNIALSADSYIKAEKTMPTKAILVDKENVKVSETVRWNISSTSNGYCLVGYSESGKKYVEESPLTYDSTAGGLGRNGDACKGNEPVVTNPNDPVAGGPTTPTPSPSTTPPVTGVGAEQVQAATANTVYSCNQGNLNGTNCVTPDASYNASSQQVYTGGYYYCNSGSLSGSTCTSTSTSTTSATYNPPSKGEYYCPRGGSLQYNATAYDRSYPSVYYGYYCFSGPYYSPNTSWNAYSAPQRDIPYYYSCPSGYNQVGTTSTCTRTTTSTRTASYQNTYRTDYSCPTGGTLNGTTCSVPAVTTTATPTTTYSCPDSSWSMIISPIDSTKRLCTKPGV